MILLLRTALLRQATATADGKLRYNS